MTSLTHGVFLDTDSLDRQDIDFSALRQTLPHWHFFPQTRPGQLVERIADCHVVISNKVILDADAIAAAPQLKLICIAATGTNNVDLEAARARDITVCNVVNYATHSVAQHVFSLILSLARSHRQYATAATNGDWSSSSQFCLLDYPITELQGKTLGIIGYGVLGQAVAAIAPAFGLQVWVAERQDATTIRKNRKTFDAVIENSDILSLHCPLTPATENFIDYPVLQRMKPSAWIINTARGGLVDETALEKALSQGEIAGAALDVLSVEPPPANHPLLCQPIPNLIITPHVAWASQKARQNLVDAVINNIENYLAHRPGEINRV